MTIATGRCSAYSIPGCTVRPPEFQRHHVWLEPLMNLPLSPDGILCGPLDCSQNWASQASQNISSKSNGSARINFYFTAFIFYGKSPRHDGRNAVKTPIQPSVRRCGGHSFRITQEVLLGWGDLEFVEQNCGYEGINGMLPAALENLPPPPFVSFSS